MIKDGLSQENESKDNLFWENYYCFKIYRLKRIALTKKIKSK